MTCASRVCCFRRRGCSIRRRRPSFVAVGPGLDWWPQHNVEMPVGVGDHVMFPWNAGTYVEVGEEKLLVLRVGQLLGRMVEVRYCPQCQQDEAADDRGKCGRCGADPLAQQS
jgi:hypothetical protein